MATITGRSPVSNLRDWTRALDDGSLVSAQTLDRWADQLQGGLRSAVQRGGAPARRAKNWLNGTWLGHPLHAALTDLPVGAWWVGTLCDLAGLRRAGDAALAVGIVGAIPTAISGTADWGDTEGKQRRLGLLHGALNAVALGCFLGSLVARRSGSRGRGVLLSTLGLGLVNVSAWIGGDIVYRWGTGVSRNAWDPAVERWQVAASADELREDALTRGEVEVDGQRLPIVLLKKGRQVLALSGVCSHWGGPLWEGRLVDGDCVQCPWHGSQFSMLDGRVRQGPAAFSQPQFEARIRNGSVEVRRARTA